MTPALLGSFEQLHGEVLGLVQVATDDASMGMVHRGSDGDRVRFGHVDDLGRHLGLARTDPRRVRAAAFAAVAACRREGHEHLGRDPLAAATARRTGPCVRLHT